MVEREAAELFEEFKELTASEFSDETSRCWDFLGK